MAFPSTTFTAYVTKILASWLQAVNDFIANFPDPVGQTGKLVQSNGTIYTLVDPATLAPSPVYYANFDFGLTNDASVDVSADFMTLCNSTLPAGATLVLDGQFLFTSAVTITGRVSIQCWQYSDYILLNVGTGNDGITFYGTDAGLLYGINGVDHRLNVYGRANACKDAVVFRRLDRSNVALNVRAGAVGYGLRVTGCLINTWNVQSTGNYSPPITSPGMQVDHMLVEKDTANAVASNTNKFWVNLEGARHGVTQSAMPGEGANIYEGEIEGLTGNPLAIADCLGLSIQNLKMEENRLECYIEAAAYPDLQALRVGPGVVNFPHSNFVTYPNSGRLDIDNAQNATIDGYYGDLSVTVNCMGTRLGQIQNAHAGKTNVLDVSAVANAPISNSTDRAIFVGGPGTPTMLNIYNNGYFDWYSEFGEAVGPPDNVTVASIGNNGLPGAGAYPGNPTGKCFRCTASGAAVFANQCQIVPTANPWTADDYVSVMIAVLVEIGQSGSLVLFYDSTAGTTKFIGEAPADGLWHEYRASCKLVAGNNWSIVLSGWDGSAYQAAKQVFVGGINIVRGPIPPSHLSDSLSRREHRGLSVTFKPPFFGAYAYVGGTGKWYKSVGNAVPGDWIILN